MSHALHAHTPTLSAVDGRGLTVRNVAYRKLQDQDEPQALTTRQAYDTAGRLTTLWDPRLWALAQQDPATRANRTHHYSLSGVPLLSKSVDAGDDLALLAEAGNVIQSWDSRDSSWLTRYDEYLRPVATIEIDAQQNARTISRQVYADNSDTSAEHNQCGQLARQDDIAGSLHFPEYGILGQPLIQSRQFLKTPDLPDWTETTDYLDLVDPEEFSTQWQHDTAGALLLQTDARDNAQRFAYSVAGDLKGVYLRLNAQDETTLVDNVIYNPFGQVEAQTAGNGVVSRATYDPASGLLQSLTATPAGSEAIQSLNYAYDPVGNILQSEDAAQPVRFFANQRIEPISHYRYDTLYQLIEATGREVSTGTSHGPALPGLQPLPPDPNQISHYTQSYDYDAAGNLLQMRHVGTQSFTRTMRVAPDCNRSLPEGEVDVDFSNGFDANGNLLQLVRGQTLEWDLRNQLQQITTVTRTTTASDHERYIYDGQGQRCRKINSTRTSSRTLNNEVRYLPGLEIRTNADGEVLFVITAQAGRSSVRILHWQAGLPSGIANDQIRYSLNDHLGSSTLELDQQGGLISQESYYPFGGTAWWAARSAVEAKYKTVRYSGKERDANGLYYYGFRYYAPWLQRWINPDPAGDIDGLNLFCFVGNNPVRNNDRDGRVYIGLDDEHERAIKEARHKIDYRGLVEFPAHQREKIHDALTESYQAHYNALYMIKAHPEESAQTMTTFFGRYYDEVKDKIIDSWERTFMLADLYRSDLGKDKFVGVKMARPVRAFVIPKDPHGRVMMSIEHIEQPDLATLLSHELSHLGDISGTPLKGASTKDYYYIKTHLDTRVLNLNVQRSMSAGVIHGGHLNIDYLPDKPEKQERFAEKIRSLHPFPEMVKDKYFAIAEFNSFPTMMPHIASENADTLTFAAHQLHEIFKSNVLPRLQRQQARHSYT